MLQFLEYLLMACVGAGAITAAVPAPASGGLAVAWKALNVLALNVGNARNAVSVARSATEPIDKPK